MTTTPSLDETLRAFLKLPPREQSAIAKLLSVDERRALDTFHLPGPLPKDDAKQDGVDLSQHSIGVSKHLLRLLSQDAGKLRITIAAQEALKAASDPSHRAEPS